MKLEDLLQLSVQNQASDLHLLPGLKPYLRIDGVLNPIKEIEELSSDEVQKLVYSVMTPEEQRAFETDLVFETALSFPDIGNFRASVFHQLHGVAAVLRVVPETIPNFDDLGLPQILKSVLTMPHGLILVAGATGSGKSTTLAALIDYINTYQASNIITIEDPIEYVHKNKLSIFNQIQIKRDTPDFPTALRASLRQDPDVILVGELRDLETMRLALTAAGTGHLVLSTLHATSAPLAINRFADVFPSEEKNRVRVLLAETLQAVVYQTLVKKISGGRAAALEIMMVTPAIRHYIRQDMPSHMESAMQTGSDKGMITLEQSLQSLVARNIINPSVADSVNVNKHNEKPQ